MISIPDEPQEVAPNQAAWAKNIAIVVLDRALKLTREVQPACLPKPHDMVGLYEDGRTALVSGLVLDFICVNF